MGRISPQYRNRRPTPEAEQCTDVRSDRPVSRHRRQKPDSRHRRQKPVSRHKPVSRRRRHNPVLRNNSRSRHQPILKHCMQQLISRQRRRQHAGSHIYAPERSPMVRCISSARKRNIARQRRRQHADGHIHAPERYSMVRCISSARKRKIAPYLSPSHTPFAYHRTTLLLDIFICQPAVRPPEMNNNTSWSTTDQF